MTTYLGAARNSAPAKKATPSEAYDMLVGDMAEQLTPQHRRAYDVLEEIRRAVTAAFILTDDGGELDVGVAQIAAENIRRLCLELVGR